MENLLTKALVQSLPDTVRLTGFGINRTVFIDDTNVEGERKTIESPFLWGSTGPRATALSLAILSKWFPEEVAASLVDTFMYGVLFSQKEVNFCLQINVKQFFSDFMEGSKTPYEGNILVLPIPEFEQIIQRGVKILGKGQDDKLMRIS